MKIEQLHWRRDGGWAPKPPGALGGNAELVLAFGSTQALKDRALVDEVRAAYPRAHLLGCSTAGEICGTEVSDDSLVVTAVGFAHTSLQGARVNVQDAGSSFEAGQRLAKALEHKGLLHVFVLSDGLKVNGSDPARGLTSSLPESVTVTGGLSGDGDRFQETLVLWDGIAAADVIAAVGFYGDRLRVGFGSLGGWDSFGPERVITRSKGNVLYELDGRSALALYKDYLGEHAKGLPATGLLFPLSLRAVDGTTSVVRTILAVNEAEQSMTFAGDVPEGSYARLMKANFNRLIDGAVGAAQQCHEALGKRPVDLAVLISCVGRKLVLRQRVEEEVEGAREVLGSSAVLTGFYSYGEISPASAGAPCELHNQTMTITAFRED